MYCYMKAGYFILRGSVLPESYPHIAMYYSCDICGYKHENEVSVLTVNATRVGEIQKTGGLGMP